MEPTGDESATARIRSFCIGPVMVIPVRYVANLQAAHTHIVSAMSSHRKLMRYPLSTARRSTKNECPRFAELLFLWLAREWHLRFRIILQEESAPLLRERLHSDHVSRPLLVHQQPHRAAEHRQHGREHKCGSPSDPACDIRSKRRSEEHTS